MVEDLMSFKISKLSKANHWQTHWDSLYNQVCLRSSDLWVRYDLPLVCEIETYVTIEPVQSP